MSCEREGRGIAPIYEPIAVPNWMRRAIECMGNKQAPERTDAIKRMKKWKQRRRTAKEERAAREKRWFAPIGAE